MLYIIIYCLPLVSIALAETKFISPPGADQGEEYRDNPIYQLNETVAIKWKSSEKLVHLGFWIKSRNTTENLSFSDIARNISDTSYEWKPSLSAFPSVKDDFDKFGHIVLHLILYVVTEAYKDGFIVATSHSVNITASASSKSSSASSTIIPTLTTTISPPSTASPLPVVPADDKPSSGVIGGAVGGTIGGLLVVGVIGTLLWRKFRKPVPKLTAKESEAYYNMPAVLDTSPEK